MFRDPFTKAAVVYLALIGIFRLWFCTQFELSGDEAYYWLWSKHLDWSYYSKGPGVALAIAFGTLLFGDTVFGVRLLAPVISSLAGFGIYLLGRMMFSSRAGFYAVVIASLTPLFLAGGIILTIDPLSVFFWIAAACVVWARRDSDRIRDWAFAGLLVGFGALCKYTNLFQILCFFLFLLASRRHRRHLVRPTFWAMVAAALIALLPPLIWNAQRDWITARHIVDRGDLDRAFTFSLSELASFIGQQILVAFPPFFAGMAAAFSSRAIRTARRTEYLYLASLSLPLFGFYTVLSMNNAGQPNWTAPSYIAAIVLLAAYAEAKRGSAGFARAARLSLGLAVAAAVVLHAFLLVRLPFLKTEPLRRLRGAADLARQVHEEMRTHDASFVITDRYSDSGLMAFYLPGQPQTHIARSAQIKNQFSFWPDYSAFTNQNAIYVSHDPAVPYGMMKEFKTVKLARETYSLHKGKYPVRKFYLFFCGPYEGPRPDPSDQPIVIR